MSSGVCSARVKLALVGLLAAASASADFDKTKWSNCVPILPGTTSGKGLVEFALTPETLDVARGDLADLRVVDANGRETACIQRLAMSATRSIPLPVRIYDRTYLPGRESSVTIDFGSKTLKNSITVTTPGTSFRRRIAIESCDDGLDWKRVRDDAFLFRVPATAGEGDAYDRKAITFPESDHRYLRVTVYNGPDDPEKVEIQNVSAERTVIEPGEVITIPAVMSLSNENQTTWIELNVGYRNLPLLKFGLTCGDSNFFRRIIILGRDTATLVIPIMGEDGVQTSRTVEKPWEKITNDAIYRYSAGGVTDESLFADLCGKRYRHIRIGISNGDDPPLRDLGLATIHASVHHVAFQPKPGSNYSLFVGNPDAHAPEYDIVNYADRLRAESVTRATLGLIASNPDFRKTTEQAPWSERHKVVLWIALLGIMAVLGSLVIRQLKTLPR